MLTIFNRRELVITTDMDRQAYVRDILSQNKINYTIKVTNLQSPGLLNCDRARMGSWGINQKHIMEYKIYVHKKDYDKALWLIHQNQT